MKWGKTGNRDKHGELWKHIKGHLTHRDLGGAAAGGLGKVHGWGRHLSYVWNDLQKKTKQKKRDEDREYRGEEESGVCGQWNILALDSASLSAPESMNCSTPEDTGWIIQACCVMLWNFHFILWVIRSQWRVLKIPITCSDLYFR